MSAAEVKRLSREFEVFARGEFAKWSEKNPVPETVRRYTNVVDEMIANGSLNKRRHASWIAHIDPLAAAWWRERGYEQVYEGDKAFVRKMNQSA